MSPSGLNGPRPSPALLEDRPPAFDFISTVKLPDRGWWGGWGVREVTDSLPAYRGTPTKMELSTGRGGAGWLFLLARCYQCTEGHRPQWNFPREGWEWVEGPGPGGGGGGSPVCRRRVGGVDVGGVTSPVVVVVGPGEFSVSEPAHRSLPFKGAKPGFALSADAHLCLACRQKWR